MKLTTLNYIHELLVENVKSKDNAKHLLSNSYRKAFNENADNTEDLHKIYMKSINSYEEACEVLRNFEEHEWR